MNENWKNEIISILSDVLREDWMTDNEWVSMVDFYIDKLGGWDKMEKEINVGIGNGYSFEKQIELVKPALRLLYYLESVEGK